MCDACFPLDCKFEKSEGNKTFCSVAIAADGFQNAPNSQFYPPNQNFAKFTSTHDKLKYFCPNVVLTGGAREAKNTNSRLGGTWPSRQTRPEVSKSVVVK